MVFSSLVFLFYFLPITMLLYFIIPDKFRNIFILLTGLLFYAWGEPKYVLIMLISTAIDYTAGLMINKFSESRKKQTVFLLVSVIMNLGLLAVFKYSSFIITTVNSVFGLNINDPQLPLPIGISFYTFQSMSYTIDLYLKKIKVQKNFFSFAAYVTLFPQIVAGPIVRYEDVAKEIDHRTISISKVSEGIGKFLKGLAKKVLLANNIGLIWTQVKAMDFGEISAATAWLGILAFTFQIYFDFSGYSDMAIGLGKMLGFNFPINFDHPYLSRSISEFWRRWHITLGSWFREYVYIPLGGNRKGSARTIINLLIVWSLTGLWHGSSWNFMLWGFYFGVLIVIERLGFGKILEKLPKAVSTVYTFVMVVFGWVLFDTNTLTDAWHYIGAMFGANGVLGDSTALYLLVSNAVIYAICIFASTDIFSKFTNKLQNSKPEQLKIAAIAAQLFVLINCTAYLVDASYNPFLYFRF
ncbi:MAG: MBOAT family O-acyltransferase [Oscillospiraceae bacterium]